MACGTPVIAANNSSIPEVCGDAAIYFDGTNYNLMAVKIDDMINSENNQEALIEKGFKQIESFCWEKTVSTVRKILGTVD